MSRVYTQGLEIPVSRFECVYGLSVYPVEISPAEQSV